MKIDRLMGIIVYLLNNGRTSAKKLAEEFEVSSRTIMRDFESLDRAGIPIQSFYGAEGGYQIMEDFVLEKQVATNHEYDWIVTALKGMASAYASKNLEQTLAKMKSLNNTEDNVVSVDFGVASEDDKINEQLMLLEDAIKKKNVVRFAYTNSHDEVKEIQVEPVKLQYKWYSWYLIGYYEKYQDYFMFKLVRMNHLNVTDIRNTKIHNLSDIKQKDGISNVVDIRIYGKAAIKSKCREYLNGQITKEFENGDFEFCFLNYCVGNLGGTIEQQINGAFNEMEERLALVGLTLENVVQMDCLFRDIWNIPVMEKVIKERFNGKYPVRKSIQTEFAHVGGEDGLLFQADAIAYFAK